MTTDEKLNPVSVSSNFPLLFVHKYAKEKIIATGLGADTIFAGFIKYAKLNKQEFEEQLKKEIDILIDFDYKEDESTAAFFNKEISMPFIDKRIADFSLNLPYEMKINNNKRKYIVRKLAENLNLSIETLKREKKSAQYGTGIMKIMIKLAKKNNLDLKDYIKKLAGYS